MQPTNVNYEVSTQAWVDTGIQAPSYPATGFTDRFDAWGTIHTPADFGPAGNMNCTAPASWVAPGLPCYALIGRFGTDGTPFFIGPFSYSGDQAPLTHPATLYLGVNGPVSGLSGNTGSWTVNVKFNVDGYWPTDTPTSASTSVAISTGVAIISTSPQGDSEAAGTSFNPSVTVQTNGFSLDCSQDFLENQDGNLFGAWRTQGCISLGNSQYQFSFGTAMTAPATAGTYQSLWQIWHYPNHVGPVIDISFVVPPSSVTLTPTGTGTAIPTPSNTVIPPSPTVTNTSTSSPTSTNTAQPTNTMTLVPTATTIRVMPAAPLPVVPTSIPPAPTPPTLPALPTAPTVAPVAPAATNTSLPATTNGLPTATTKPAQPPSNAVPTATPSVVTDTSGGTVTPPSPTQQHSQLTPPNTTSPSKSGPTINGVRVPGGVLTENSVVMVSGRAQPYNTVDIGANLTTTTFVNQKVVIYVRPGSTGGAQPHINPKAKRLPVCRKGVKGCVARTVTRRVGHVDWLYHATTRVHADRTGRFSATVHLRYRAQRTMHATLIVTVRTSQGQSARYIRVMVAPSSASKSTQRGGKTTHH